MIIQLPFINPGFKDIYNTAGNDTLPTNSFCLGKYSWPLSHTSFDAWTSQVRCVHWPSSQKSLCNFAVGFPYLQFLIWGFNQPPTVMKHLVFKRFFKKRPSQLKLVLLKCHLHAYSVSSQALGCLIAIQCLALSFWLPKHPFQRYPSEMSISPTTQLDKVPRCPSIHFPFWKAVVNLGNWLLQWPFSPPVL